MPETTRPTPSTPGYPDQPDQPDQGLRDVPDPAKLPRQLRLRNRIDTRDVADRYRLLIELIPDGVVVHQRGHIVYANRAAQRLLGGAASQLLGREVQDFVPPEDRLALVDQFAGLTAPGCPSPPTEMVLLSLDGNRTPIETTAVVTSWQGRPALQMILRDLTERRAAEAAEERFSVVVDALEEGVITVDAAGLLRSVNPAAARLLGIAADRLIGIPAAELPLLDADGGALAARNPLAVTHRTGEPRRGQTVVVDRPDGSRVWLTADSRSLSGAVPGAAAVLSLSDVTERRDAAARVHHAATHDPLTGLPNRAMLLEQIAETRRGPSRPDRPRDAVDALLYVDLDNFKALNDTAGQSLGDDALRLVAKRLLGQVRGTDLVARIAGDEFVVLAAVDDVDDARALAGRVLSGLTRPATGRLRGHQLRASIGIVTADADDARDPLDLLRDADAAMGQAKASGRNRVAVFDAELRADVQRRTRLETDLRDALAGSGLWVAYQPLVNLASLRWTGAEALSRWTHPTLGAVSPLEFVGVAEQSELIHALGARTLATACRDAVTLRSATSAPLTMSVNVSVRQLDDPDLSTHVEEMLSVSGLPAAALCLEVTESSLALDEVRAGRSLEPLRALGVQVAIDDFGTGYSSLARLRTLPVDELKIDRSFVTTLPSDRQARHVVAGIITLAHALDMRVVAEGVETAEHARILTDLACDLAQGYYFGRPVRAAGFCPPDPGGTPDPRPPR